MLKKSYKVGNKDKIQFEVFYHDVIIFKNTMGCCCEHCKTNGNRIYCTDEITEYKDPLMKIFTRSDNYKTVFINSGIKLPDCNNKYLFDKCYLCKGYSCKKCFPDRCPECEIPIVDKELFIFYKYLSQHYNIEFKQLMNLVSKPFNNKLVNGVMHDEHIYYYCKGKGILCNLCESYYCDFCFHECPNITVHDIQ